MASSTLRNFTNLALTEFIEVYGDIMKEKQPTVAMSGEELQRQMQKKIFDLATTPAKKPSCQVEMESADVCLEPIAEESDIAGKLTLKELKSNPLEYTINEKNKDGVEEPVTKSIDLPWLPDCIDYSCGCQALKVNGGLFTPCTTRPSKDSNFCKVCEKQELKYGQISDRSNTPVPCYVDPNGKNEISFGTYCAKRELSREMVKRLIQEKYGNRLIIPEHYWNVDKIKAARKAIVKGKTVSTSSDEVSSTEGSSQDGEEPKRKRGRPRKNPESNEPPKPKGKRGRPKKTVQAESSVVPVVEQVDWMAGIAAESASSDGEHSEESNEDAKAAKKAEKEAAKLVKQQEAEAAKAEKEAAKLAKQEAAAAAKAEKEAAKLVKQEAAAAAKAEKEAAKLAKQEAAAAAKAEKEAAKLAKQEAAAAAKAEKEAAKLAKQEAAAAAKAEKEAAKLAKQEAAAAAKAEKETEVAEEVTTNAVESQETNVPTATDNQLGTPEVQKAIEKMDGEESDGEESDNSDDEEEEMTFFSWQGNEYCYDDEYTLYKILDGGDDFEHVGRFDSETNKPVFTEDEEDC
jgi:hypothetical protein